MENNYLNSLIEKMNSGKIPVMDPGIMSYRDAFDFQNSLTGEIYKSSLRGAILLMEHPPVITIGSNCSAENLLTPESVLEEKGIELINSNRGGDITLHGPGQLICYPVFNLNFFKKDLTLFVYNLEKVIINTLLHFGISGRRVEKHRGVFIGNKKIASIGLRVRKWISMHGFSLNVSIDLSYFKHIIACGLKDYPQTSMFNILKKDIPINNVKEQVLESFEKVFDISVEV